MSFFKKRERIANVVKPKKRQEEQDHRGKFENINTETDDIRKKRKEEKERKKQEKKQRTKHRLMREGLYGLLAAVIFAAVISFTDIPHLYFFKKHLQNHKLEQTLSGLRELSSDKTISQDKRLDYWNKANWFEDLVRLRDKRLDEYICPTRPFFYLSGGTKRIPTSSIISDLDIIYSADSLSSIIKNNKRVLVEVSSDFCRPCHQSFPFMAEFKNNHPEIKVVVFELITGEKEERKKGSIVCGENIAAIPIFFYFENGTVKRKRLGGLISDLPLEELIK